MDDPKLTDAELAQYLDTLDGALRDLLQRHGRGVTFIGLPIEEWAGPGYAIGALFDPVVLTAPLKPARVYLAYPPDAPETGTAMVETRQSQKERIAFRVNAGRAPEFHLPTLWGGVAYQRLEADATWSVRATIAELPALLVRPGAAVFAFNPLRVLHRYLLMADPTTTRDLTDLLVVALLGTAGIETELDDHDLRRDFHALGINVLLVTQLGRASGKSWDSSELKQPLLEAATRYCRGDFVGAESILGGLFRLLEARRKERVPKPIAILVMPHGGILFPNEGYAEFDWPEAAAKALNLFLDWAERLGFSFAPDIGAGTLEEFAKLHPATIRRFRDAWEAGRIEFVNGSYAQPYAQLLNVWDQDKQFEMGLKVFDILFGRHPCVYAAQELALHPSMPDLLRKHGYTHAIHRSQNMGLAPLDTAALIEWTSPAGAGIRTLPAHPLRSERRGGEMWRHFPVALASEKNRDLPFIALTSLMDQTFIDLYFEEILRANRYAPVWGEFLTPSAFFERTRHLAAETRVYHLDQYQYVLDLSGNAIHGHQTGGYASQLAFIFRESASMQARERQGVLTAAELKRLLNQEAHDSYIIPYFATGYFMEGGLTDYQGPRYRCSNDKPRGIDRCIRDSAGYPTTFQDGPQVVPDPCRRVGGTLIGGDGTGVGMDLDHGAVVNLAGRSVRLGALMYEGKPFAVRAVKETACGLTLEGVLPGFGDLTLEYCFSAGWLYGVVSVGRRVHQWDDQHVGWGDAVYLEHAHSAAARIVRTVSGVSEPTTVERFHSLESLVIEEPRSTLRLRHGGNIFFRRTATAVQNRLWCYDEFCDRLYWAVSLG